MNHRIFKSLFAAAVSILLASSAWAGGLYLTEVASDDVGLAGAGFASRAQDATTLFSNPAGMTRLEKSELQIGAEAIYLNAKFSPNSNTSTANRTMPGSPLGTGTADGNASDIIPAGGIFYTQKISDQFAAGFGVFGFFGLSAKWEDNWVGRYYGTKVVLQGLTLMPAVAYKVSDKVSLGAGLNATYGTLEEIAAVNNRGPLNPTAADGSMTIKDNVWGYGGKFGVLYEPEKGTRVGLTYLTQTKMDFTATPTVVNVRPALAAAITRLSLDMTFRAPQQVILSLYRDLTDKWALMGDLGWENWANFGMPTVAVTVDETSASFSPTVNAHFKDTWHIALGAQCKLSEPWLISFGGAYDSTMVDGANRPLILPFGAMWRFGVGTKYAMSQTMTLSGGYEMVWMGNLSIDQNRGPLAGRVSGEYNNMSMNVLTVLWNWKI